MNYTNKPIYIQIADKISDRIAIGNPAEGERIMSVREIAAAFEVNINTASRTLDHLQQLGLIFNRRGIGYFVSENARNICLDIKKNEFLAHEAPNFFQRLRTLGITPEALAVMYGQYIDNLSHPGDDLPPVTNIQTESL